jgi:hypothetical protein
MKGEISTISMLPNMPNNGNFIPSISRGQCKGKSMRVEVPIFGDKVEEFGMAHKSLTVFLIKHENPKQRDHHQEYFYIL